VRENPDDLGFAEDFFHMIPKEQYIKEVIGKLDLIKIKNCSSVKNITKRVRRQVTD
jgi:hypothetical protein